ncbi:uncharacterized protein I206_102408 [Kwoniella pini CBS 10737]|uniref:Peroxin-3 n=1 Tax=Kwoniella pini CBS 10737 TaxID=1296096 RepID=A0A1B9I594_9TREE|nr:uncharacterized protein I206_02755 [Kwoniella pini CBS 10737]OCF50699.1 hypothetical protein I206_02755 [Kwoniella pini CBS 10737]
MSTRNENPWQKRIRRLFFFVGTASTVWFVSSYILERLKETRLKAIKEKKQKNLMKNHFTSLISTISFTLYALLPTIQPQLFETYNTEEISQALQGLSSSSITNTESLSESTSSLDPSITTGNSLMFSENPIKDQPISSSHSEASPTHTEDAGTQPGIASSVTESWASEFERRENGSEPEIETEDEGRLGSSIGQIDTEDAMSSVVSQSISLPPTDTSSPSPPSDLSNLHPSPPRSNSESETRANKWIGKSKKELWKELKLQTLTRTITTIYLLPMLYLLTASQLSILARSKYLKDVKESIQPIAQTSNYPEEEPISAPRIPSDTERQKKKGWFSLSSYSIESMGLSEYAGSASSIIPNPMSILPSSLTGYFPSIISPYKPLQVDNVRQSEEILAIRKREEEEIKEEAERLFLTYSWWFLNKGWKSVAERVEESVEKIFANMPLKKELSVEDWEMKLKEVRAEIEMELSANSTIELYDFTSHILPITSSSSHDIEIPYPKSPSDHSNYLQELYDQSKEQIKSSDGRYLIEKGISTLMGNLIKSLKIDLYNCNENDSNVIEKRLVDCLPVINLWGKGIWQGIPDSGIESLINIQEFESFSALIFGDWAPRL